jgi:hypothetical protein
LSDLLYGVNHSFFVQYNRKLGAQGLQKIKKRKGEKQWNTKTSMQTRA